MRFLVRCSCCFHHMASYRKSFESESGRWGAGAGASGAGSAGAGGGTLTGSGPAAARGGPPAGTDGGRAAGPAGREARNILSPPILKPSPLRRQVL